MSDQREPRSVSVTALYSHWFEIHFAPGKTYPFTGDGRIYDESGERQELAETVLYGEVLP